MGVKNTYSTLLGGSDAFSIADHSDLKPTGSFTVGVWIKTTTKSREIFWSGRYVSSVYSGIGLSIDSSDHLDLLTTKNTGEVDGTDYKEIRGSTVLTDGNWHFIVGVWDGSYLRVYVDGIQDATPVSWANAPAYNVTNYVRVGCYSIDGSNNGFFVGNMDGFFLVNGTALTQAQIATLMYQDLTGTTNLKAYYKFENDTTDSSGNSHTLTAIGSPTYPSTPDSVPFTYYLESTDNLTSINIPTASYLYRDDAMGITNGTCTLECWVKINTQITTGIWPIFSKSSTSTNVTYDILYNYNSGTYQLRFERTREGTAVDRISVTYTLPVGVWVHLAITYDGTYIRAYINGILNGSPTSSSGDGSSGGVDRTIIGAYADKSNNILNAKISHARVFSDERIASEIFSDMVSRTITNANLVAEYVFEGVLTDSSGNSRTLTASGSPVYNPDQPFDIIGARQSIKLISASSQTVSIVEHADLRPTGNFTIGTWINLNSAISYSGILQSWYYPASSISGFMFDLGNDGLHPRIVTGKDTGQTEGVDYEFNQSSTSIGTGGWHWVVGTWDGTKLHIYIDGIEEGTGVSWSTAPVYNANCTVRIGCVCQDAASNQNWTNGKFRNIFLVNGTAWDATKIAFYMDRNINPIETNLKLLMNFDNNYIDRSGNGHNGTPIATPTLTFTHIVPFDGSVTSVDIDSEINSEVIVQENINSQINSELTGIGQSSEIDSELTGKQNITSEINSQIIGSKTVPSSLNYRILVQDENGNYIGEFDKFRNLNFGKRLNNYGQAYFEIPVIDPKTSSLVSLRQYTVWIYLNDKGVSTLVWSGEQALREGVLDENGNNWATIYCYTWLEQLNARFTNSERIFTNVDQGEIAWELIDETQKSTQESTAKLPTTETTVNDGWDWFDVDGIEDVGGTAASAASNSVDYSNTDYIKAEGFGFSIPTEAIILGIEVEINRRGGNSESPLKKAKDYSLKLIRNDTVVGDDNADLETDYNYPTYESVFYGDSSDLWGTTWTPTDINDSTFGVQFATQMLAETGTNSADIDYIKIKIYYNEPNSDGPILANVNNDFGIREGVIQTTISRDRSYYNQNIMEALVNLTNVLSGFDLDITNDRVFNVYSTKGIDRTEDIIFEYGTNVVSAKVTEDFVGITNKAIVIGQSTDDTSDLIRIERNDTDSQTNYKLRESLDSEMDVSNTNTLEDKGDAILRKYSQPLLKVDMELVDNRINVTQFDVGDLIRLIIKNGIYNIDEEYRVFEYTVTYNDSNTEHLNLVLGKFTI